MEKHNHSHDIEITTPSTVFTFISKYTFQFSLWFILFILVPIYLIITKNPEIVDKEVIEDGFVMLIVKLLINLIVFLVYLFMNYLVLVSSVVEFSDKLKLLLSSKIIRLERHQITFIPAIESFQKDPIKLPSNLLELLVVEEHLEKQPATVVEFTFISKDAPPLTFFSTKDAVLAEKIDQEIANFYQIKLTEKLKDRSTWE
jgi:hypothetical protein